MDDRGLQNLSLSELKQREQDATRQEAELQSEAAGYGPMMIAFVVLMTAVFVGWPLIWGVSIWMLFASIVVFGAGIYILVRYERIRRQLLPQVQGYLRDLEVEIRRRS